MKRDYLLYIWRNNNSNGMGGVNVLDNIVVFYIFFTIVGFLAAMIGTIIGAGGGPVSYTHLDVYKRQIVYN